MDIEKYLIKRLSGVLSVHVGAEVPKDRPEAFVVVERVGGSSDGIALDRPSVSIQSWSTSRQQASELAQLVDDFMFSIADGDPITHVERNSLYNFPSPDNIPRYQGMYDLVAHI